MSVFQNPRGTADLSALELFATMPARAIELLMEVQPFPLDHESSGRPTHRAAQVGRLRV